MDKTEIYSM